jgi:hypothetical protein
MGTADGCDEIWFHGSRVISPGGTDVSEDIRDIVVTEGGTPWWHGPVVGNSIDLDRADQAVEQSGG